MRWAVGKGGAVVCPIVGKDTFVGVTLWFGPFDVRLRKADGVRSVREKGVKGVTFRDVSLKFSVNVLKNISEDRGVVCRSVAKCNHMRRDGVAEGGFS